MRLRLPIPAAALTAALIAACSTTTVADTDHRAAAISRLANAGYPHTAAAVAQAPFMTTPDRGADIQAIAAITHLTQRDIPLPVPISTLTDHDTWRLAALPHFLDNQPSRRIPAITDPHRWSQTVRRTEDVDVAILFPNASEPDIPWPNIELAIRNNVRLTGQTLPPRHGHAIIIVYGAHFNTGVQAMNHDQIIAIRSAYARDRDAASWILAHEITHLWWSGNAPYVDEGIAELVAELSTNGPQPVDTILHCPSNTFDPDHHRPPQECDYQAASHMFQQLLRKRGKANFKTLMSELYSRSGEDRPILLPDLLAVFNNPEDRRIIEQQDIR